MTLCETQTIGIPKTRLYPTLQKYLALGFTISYNGEERLYLKSSKRVKLTKLEQFHGVISWINNEEKQHA